MTWSNASVLFHFEKPNGDPAEGAVTFFPNSDVILDTTGHVTWAGPQSFELDENGEVSVSVPPTDTGELAPSQRQWKIRVRLNHTNRVPTLVGQEFASGQTYHYDQLVDNVVASPVFDSWLDETTYLATVAALQAADTSNASAISAEASLRVSGDAAAVATAAADATSKANAAQSAATSAAATDATTKANAAQTAAAADATSKVATETTRASAAEVALQNGTNSTFEARQAGLYVPTLVPTYAAPRTHHWTPAKSAYNLKGSNTRRLRASLAGALAGTGLCKMALAGASNTVGAGVGAGNVGKLDPATQLRKLFGAIGFPVAGTGFVYAENNLPATGWAGFDYRYTLGGTWTRAGDPSLPYLYATGSGRTMTFVSDLPGTVVEILTYNNTAAATFSVTVDGSAQAAWTPDNTNTVKLISYTVPDTLHTVALTTSAAASVIAIRVRRTTGVDVTNAGQSGSTAGNWLANGAAGAWIAPLSVLKAQTPDFVVVDLYGNELLQDIAVATFQANLLNLVQQIQAIGADVILCPAPEPNPAGTPKADGGSYATTGLTQAKVEAKLAAIYNVADTADVPVIDANDALGLYAQANANGLMIDAIHFNEKGSAAVAQVIGAAIDPVGAGSAPSTLPSIVNVPATVKPTASSSAMTIGYVAAAWYNAWAFADGTSGNYYEYEVSCAAGTYELRMLWAKLNNAGIAVVSIDGVDLSPTVDMYAASAVNNQATSWSGVLSAGKHTVRFRSSTKNASSSAYFVPIHGFSLTRTGA